MRILVRRVVSCMFVLSLIAFPASADTFTVDDTGDDPDANPGDGTCATSGGVCTLRAAIQEANATANAGGPDFIEFAISGPTPHVIQPGSTMPTVTEPVFIKGDSEPDYVDTPVIVVDGQNAGTDVDGLTFDALNAGSLVQALSIINFDGDGILLDGTGSTLIYNNYIGVAADGSAAGNDGAGVTMTNGASSNTIGLGSGTTNVISNNGEYGIFIGAAGGESNNRIKGNLIGVDPSGTTDMGNNFVGILANRATNTTIGGSLASERNVISGNALQGIRIFGGDATIEGNYIGINEAGDAAIANDQDGIELESGASVAVTDNVVSGNTERGIELVDSGTQADIKGNSIGTNAATDTAIPNGTGGISIGLNTGSSTIGGTSSGATNVIVSGTGAQGLFLDDGNTVQGNYFNTNSNGDELGVGGGIRLFGDNNTIGGATAGAGNIMAVGISGEGDSNVIRGNYIGTNPNGDNLGGGTGTGIDIFSSGSNNVIGGVNAGEANVIAFQATGVAFAEAFSNFPKGNSTRGNTIRDNTIGIDVGDDGVTPNDAGDSDDGPNRLQNFPEIPNADYDSGANEVTVTYRVPSDPSLSGSGASVYPLTIDFYQADADGNGEAYLGTDTYSATDYNNGPDKSITFTPGASVTAADDIVATATDANGNTSEFTEASQPLPVELAGLEAQRSGSDAVTVRWQTLSETNNAGFEVQRRVGSTPDAASESNVETPQWDVSTTGEEWQTIATVEGAGTTDQPQSYRFEDADLPYAADSLSYRLRQIDTGGTESFSEAVTIARTVQSVELLPAYPNPAHSQATVRFAVPDQQPVRIQLYDMLGRTCAQ